MKEIKILPSKVILKNGNEKLLKELSRKEKSLILENLSKQIKNSFSANPEKLRDFSNIIK